MKLDFRSRLFATFACLVALYTGVLVAQSLPTQVLQLLARANTWTATQTFNDFRLPVLLPADTTRRLYTDGTNLFWNGSALTGSGSTTAPHNLLSTTHPDTLAVSPPTRGDLLVANSTPVWARFAKGGVGTFLSMGASDPAWTTDGSTFTVLNATSLTSGTVALARLPTTIANANIDAAAAIAWTKISKTGSSFADFTTKSATDITSGTLADARLSSLVSLFGTSVGTTEIDAGAVTAAKLADFSCTAGQAMTWQLTGWTCGTFGTGSGSVTSVALSLPAIITVTGSPITTTGTLTGTLATQVLNTVWAGPAAAGPSAPTFRSLVTADFPLSGVAAGTYVKATVNTRGIITAALTAIDLATDVAATILPFANGGTGLSTAADDTTMVSSGAAWQAKTLSNCTTTPLGYTQATNLFSCLTTLSGLASVSTTSLTVGGGSAVTKISTGTATYDPGAVSDQTSVTTTLTVTGAAVGQVCTAALSTIDSENLMISAFPSAADTVRVVVGNISGGPLSPGSGTLRATCISHS